ncbi:MAG: M15 family metallopeptidase [Bacteroidia bacterium]|nr:M15 family metallopeptidase [Bacteroidia bacterium]NNF29995.1 M15 family metallopeptidase [Flavobacteriaceae bacterium]MBT8276025.1 M15 family metallopeptidase [Bacteroidia bacterium]NNJ83199.1 M15 family metallopeptidase [Flavobacteriaceae bacterium]NNK53700.1 M15 family metallopeptidase [Flavobacteriaceae bacterium]
MKMVPIYIITLLTVQLQSQSNLVDIASLSTEFDYEIRYATSDNFIGEVLYDCPKCLLQKDVANALLKANQYFCELGYRIKLYDCYRPLDIQKKMWAKVPRATYVANPYDKGSIHNKGAAVDITLVTLEGCYVEMGTDYDYFGREAHIDYFNFPEDIIANRNLLMDGMKKFGFKTIRSEWWHFSFRKNMSFPTMNEPLPCED